MLVMTDELQNFIDEQVMATSTETNQFLTQQVEQMVEDDPEGHKAEAIIRYWYEKRHNALALSDRLRLMFACHVIKTLTMRAYVQESKRLNFWQLVGNYQKGNLWRQQTACGEIVYRVRKHASEADFIDWLKGLLESEGGQEVVYLLETPERFVALSR